MTSPTVKLNICHVITRMNLGGAQENTLLTCQGLVARGHDVTLITGLSEGPEGNLLKAADTTGIHIVEIPELQRSISCTKDRAARAKLIDVIGNGHFDVVHTHMSKAGVLGREAARHAHVPFIAHTVHGLSFHPFQSPLRNFLFKLFERRAARKCDKIFAVAQAMVQQCIDARIAPADKYKVVYSGMNLDTFLNARPDAALRSQLALPENAPVIGMVARMFQQKGYEDFLQVAPIIAKALPDVRFLLVGDGIMRPEIENCLQEMGLREQTVFTGLVPPQDVAKYLPLMDIMLHLSLHEGLPRTVVQACACSVPPVAYDLDGTPEVIEDGINGYLITPRDHAETARQAVALYSDFQRRKEFGAKGKAKVQEMFAAQRMVDILEAEYLEGICKKCPERFR